MDEKILEVRGLKRKYPVSVHNQVKDEFLLNISDLDIIKGEDVAIIGNNGSGKTTFLMCLANLLKIDEGTIKFWNEGVEYEISKNKNLEENENQRIDFRKSVGIVFQTPNLWPHMTILQNVAAPLRDIGSLGNSAEVEAKKWLRDLEIGEEFFNKKPSQLSGGLQQRVSIARTLAIRPKILLLDEFTSNLDPEITEKVLNIIDREFLSQKEKTLIMVTHRIDFVSKYSTKILIMHKGLLIREGTPQEILYKEKSEQVRNIVDPTRSQWHFSYRGLESAINITSQTLLSEEKKGNIFQYLAEQVLKLVDEYDPKAGHLILVATWSREQKDKIVIRGADMNNHFDLNGDDIDILASIISPRNIINKSKLQNPTSEINFDTENGKRSFIAQAFTSNTKPKYVYAEHYLPIEGVMYTDVEHMSYAERMVYYKFSKSTKHVYQFAMEWISSEGKNEIIGVLSIDTTSEKKWLPFVIEQLKLLANLGAVTIKLDERGAVKGPQ